MMNSVPLTITHPQMVDGMSDTCISEPSSPESEPFDAADLLTTSVNDDITTQLAAAGPIGVAAAAAVLSCRKRKHPHHFETNPSKRKRQQTRLLRKLKHTIDEYTTRVGQQAVVLCCTPGKSQTMQMYKVFGSQPLENVIRSNTVHVLSELETVLSEQAPPAQQDNPNLHKLLPLMIRSNKVHVLSELETALSEQAPPAQQDNPNLHELPHLVVDGIPTPVDKMTQAQLRNFIPEMLKYSTGRSKPGWGKIEYRPVWWPSDLPWANVRSDARTDEDKKKVPWTEALRLIVKNCYKHHGREDLLQVFNEEYSNTVQVQTQGYNGTMMQTINNPDGTVSIIQIDSGPNSVVTLPDGTQATVVHAIQDANPQQILQHVSAEQNISLTSDNVAMVPGSQQQVINSLQASLNQAGHIILAGGDTAQLNSIMTMVPVSMYQAVQGISAVQAPVGTALHTLPGLSITQGLPQNVQLAMAPVLNTPLDSIAGDQSTTESTVSDEQSVETTAEQEMAETPAQQQQEGSVDIQQNSMQVLEEVTESKNDVSLEEMTS